MWIGYRLSCATAATEGGAVQPFSSHLPQAIPRIARSNSPRKPMARKAVSRLVVSLSTPYQICLQERGSTEEPVEALVAADQFPLPTAVRRRRET
jgi:hypothetical protein